MHSEEHMEINLQVKFLKEYTQLDQVIKCSHISESFLYRHRFKVVTKSTSLCFIYLFFSQWQTKETMNFMSNSLRILLLIVFALFSCAFENVSSDSKLGNCLDYDLMRSPLLVKQTVHRPKNTIISQLYTTNWTVRFPEVLTSIISINQIIISLQVTFFVFFFFVLEWWILFTNQMHLDQCTWRTWWIRNCSIGWC